MYKHGYEQYLAKYISKAEPSSNIDLKYLRTRVIGSVEAVEVLEFSPKPNDQTSDVPSNGCQTNT